MPAGRPSKYTPELIALAEKYLDEWSKQDDLIPSHAGLAVYLHDNGCGVRRETLYAWAKDDDKEKFSNILDKILAVQENKLINNGLSGEFNSNITKLVLGKHGYSEKQETDIKAQIDLQEIKRTVVDPENTGD